MYSKPKLLQGVFPFEGRGIEEPFPLPDSLTYVVPSGKRAQLIYFRAGNTSDETIYVVLMRDNQPMRYFPIGAKSASHVALAVVEDMLSDTFISTFLGAPKGAVGSVILDIGLVEI